MKIFKDEQLQEEIAVFNLGTVEAGTEKTYKYFMYNDNKDALVEEISLEFSSQEIEIVDLPKEIKSSEKASFILKWKPSVTLKKGLNESIKINFSEVYE